MKYSRLVCLSLLHGALAMEDADKWKATPTKSWVTKTKITAKPELPETPILDGVCSELIVLATLPAVVDLCSAVGVVPTTTTLTETTTTVTTETDTITEISTTSTTTTVTTDANVPTPLAKRGLDLKSPLDGLLKLKEDALASACSCILAAPVPTTVTDTATSTELTSTTTTTTTTAVETSILPLPCDFHYESRLICSNRGTIQGAACGGRITGTGAGALPFFSTNPPNYIDCVNTCAQYANCASWSYQRDLGGNTCYMYQNTNNNPVYITDFDAYSIRGYKQGGSCDGSNPGPI